MSEGDDHPPTGTLEHLWYDHRTGTIFGFLAVLWFGIAWVEQLWIAAVVYLTFMTIAVGQVIRHTIDGHGDCPHAPDVGAVSYLWGHHRTKTLMIGGGVVWLWVGVSLPSGVGVFIGVVFTSIGIGQLVTYWRHDHDECDHPACSD